jgi:hypothetical protein
VARRARRGTRLEAEPALNRVDSRRLGPVDRADCVSGSLDRREVAGGKAALGLQSDGADCVDIRKRVHGRLARGDRARQCFLRIDPAFAAGRSGIIGGAFGDIGGTIERRAPALSIADQLAQLRGERRRDRSVIDRPLDRDPRVDGLGGTRLERGLGPAGRCAGSRQNEQQKKADRGAHRCRTNRKRAGLPELMGPRAGCSIPPRRPAGRRRRAARRFGSLRR